MKDYAVKIQIAVFFMGIVIGLTVGIVATLIFYPKINMPASTPGIATPTPVTQVCHLYTQYNAFETPVAYNQVCLPITPAP